MYKFVNRIIGFSLLAFFSAELVANDCEDIHNAARNYVSSYANPFENVILSAKEEIVFSDEIMESTKKEHPEMKLKNGKVYDYTLFLNGENMRLKREFMSDDEVEVKIIDDVYFSGNTSYSICSLDTHWLNIDNSDSFDYKNLKRIYTDYFQIFDVLKSALLDKSSQVKKSDNDYLISWQNDSKQYLFHIDTTTLFPLTCEIRLPDGDLYETLCISKMGNVFLIKKEKYGSANKKDVTQDLSVKFISEAKDFPTDKLSDKLGYRTVEDKRNSTIRKYAIFNIIPDKKFIDELFKNPDDVARYNKEIHRLAHPDEDIK